MHGISHYVVCGPGRCGGNLLKALIQAAGKEALHTHNRDFSYGNDPATAWIQVDRKDIFAAVCSNIVANRSGQSTHYDEHCITPFTIHPAEFQWFYQKHLDYRQNYWQKRSFARRDHFWFEDFVGDWSVVWHRLDLQCDPDKIGDADIKRFLNCPAPYNYKDIIINHNELRNWIVY